MQPERMGKKLHFELELEDLGMSLGFLHYLLVMLPLLTVTFILVR